MATEDITVKVADNGFPAATDPAMGEDVVPSFGLTNGLVTIADPGRLLKGIYAYNPSNAVAYIQVFNAIADAVTLGTTNPNAVFGIPTLAGSAPRFGDIGLNFGSGIVVAATTTPTGSDAPSLSVVATFMLGKTA